MKDKEKDNQQNQLQESQYDKNPPVEFLEGKNRLKETLPVEDDKHDDLEKFEKGELGAAGTRYNDDGPPKGESRKIDI